MARIGIIGGSGLDDPGIIEDAREVTVDTAWGAPSSPLTCGAIGGVEVAILARHGRDHSIYPGGVNYRANIAALAEHGCTHVLAATAVGSLREEIAPGHLVFPSQFIDLTRHRRTTFFDTGEVVHTPMAEPFCSATIEVLADCAARAGLAHHRERTVVTIEGPRFSTRAESRMFRAWGADVINMSTCPEAALARERGLHYATVAMSTDYDCWHHSEEPVSWEMIVATMQRNAAHVVALFVDAVPRLADLADDCNR